MSSDQTRTWIRRASTAAGLAYTAIAEYELARRLGARAPIAVMLPMSIDCYVIAALKWFRPLDVALSLILMCAAQVAAHALEAGVVHVTLELVTVVSLLVPVALWRTHALARNEDDVPAPAVVEYATPVEVERVPEAYPEIEAPVPAVPEAVPAGVRLLPIVARPVEALDVIQTHPVLAAEEPRTRPGVHAEYVPETAPGGLAQAELDDAALLFKDELLDGKIPGIARIKAECRVGQDKAKEIQDGLRQAQAAWSLAGSGATS